MDLLLGLDVGTTAVKAALYDTELRLVASSQASYRRGLVAPHEGWAEHDTADLWQGIVDAVRPATAQAAGKGVIRALSLSTQGGTTIALDRSGQSIRPAISWMDTHVTGLPLTPPWTAAALYRATGWWSDNGLPLNHMRWLSRNEPAAFARTARFVFVNDFVIARMTGAYAMDPSNAAITMLYSLAGGDWHNGLLELAGVARTRLSPVIPCGEPVGRLQPTVAAELGLPTGVIVANGAHDQYCTALGAGVLQPGSTLIGSGTAWVLFFAAGHALFDDRQVFHPGPHVMPGHWGALSSIPSAGAGIEWYLRQMSARAGAQNADKYRWLNDGAAQAPAGSRNLLFMPHLGGFYSAAGDTPVRGTWIGLTLAHSTNEMSRSIMEGVAYEVRRLVGLAEEAGVPIRAAKMVGGATSSPLWPQIVADVLSIPVALPPAMMPPVAGRPFWPGWARASSAMRVMALLAAGMKRPCCPPNLENTRCYSALYATYLDAFARLGPVFTALQR